MTAVESSTPLPTTLRWVFCGCLCVCVCVFFLLSSKLWGSNQSTVINGFACVTCRYTSVPTLETSRTSVIILAVGRSLQQVAVDQFSFSHWILLYLCQNCDIIGLADCQCLCLDKGTDWRVTHAHTRGRSHTDVRNLTAANPSKPLETFKSTQGLIQVHTYLYLKICVTVL